MEIILLIWGLACSLFIGGSNGQLYSLNVCSDPFVVAGVIASNAGCLSDFESLVNSTNPSDICQYFEGGLECAAQFIADNGDGSFNAIECLNSMKAVVVSDTDSVKDTIQAILTTPLSDVFLDVLATTITSTCDSGVHGSAASGSASGSGSGSASGSASGSGSGSASGSGSGSASGSDSGNGQLYLPSDCSNPDVVADVIANASGCLSYFEYLVADPDPSMTCTYFEGGLECAAEIIAVNGDGLFDATECLNNMKAVVFSDTEIVKNTINAILTAPLQDGVLDALAITITSNCDSGGHGSAASGSASGSGSGSASASGSGSYSGSGSGTDGYSSSGSDSYSGSGSDSYSGSGSDSYSGSGSGTDGYSSSGSDSYSGSGSDSYSGSGSDSYSGSGSGNAPAYSLSDCSNPFVVAEVIENNATCLNRFESLVSYSDPSMICNYFDCGLECAAKLMAENGDGSFNANQCLNDMKAVVFLNTDNVKTTINEILTTPLPENFLNALATSITDTCDSDGNCSAASGSGSDSASGSGSDSASGSGSDSASGSGSVSDYFKLEESLLCGNGLNKTADDDYCQSLITRDNADNEKCDIYVTDAVNDAECINIFLVMVTATDKCTSFNEGLTCVGTKMGTAIAMSADIQCLAMLSDTDWLMSSLSQIPAMTAAFDALSTENCSTDGYSSSGSDSYSGSGSGSYSGSGSDSYSGSGSDSYSGSGSDSYSGSGSGTDGYASSGSGSNSGSGSGSYSGSGSGSGGYGSGASGSASDIPCVTSDDCLPFSPGYHCDFERSICMKDTVEICTSDNSCPLNVIKCRTDTSDTALKICTPVEISCEDDADCQVPLETCNVASGLCQPISCTAEEVCLALDEYTACSEQFCQCKSGFMWDNTQGSCVKIIGNACSSDESCPLQDAFCEAESGQCQCMDPYIDTNDICEMDPDFQVLGIPFFGKPTLFFHDDLPVTGLRMDLGVPYIAPSFQYLIKVKLGSENVHTRTLTNGSTFSNQDLLNHALLVTDRDLPSDQWVLQDELSFSVEVKNIRSDETLIEETLSDPFSILTYDQSVALTKGDSAGIQISLAVPVGSKEGENREINILLTEINQSYTCQEPSIANVGTDVCGCKFPTYTKADVDATGLGFLELSAPDSITCQIRVVGDFYKTDEADSSRQMGVAVEVTGSAEPVPQLEGSFSNSINVDVSSPSDDSTPVAMLFPTGEIITFDGQANEWADSTEGCRTVYKNSVTNSELITCVKTSTIGSWMTPYKWYAKSGKAVFKQENTDDSHVQAYTQDDVSNPITVKELSKSVLHVRFQGGAEVIIYVGELDIFFSSFVIFGDASDFSNAEGEFGDFDGNRNNDAAMGLGLDNTDYDNQAVLESLSSFPVNKKKCICPTASTLDNLQCSAQDEDLCVGTDSFNQFSAPTYDYTLTKRKRRSVTAEDDVAPVVPLSKRSVSKIHNIKKRSIPSCADFAAECSVVSHLPAKLSQHINWITQQCTAKEVINSTIDWVRLYCIPFQIAVKAYWHKNLTFRAENPDLNNQICVGGCSNGGSCVEGQCVCTETWGGEICDIDKSQPPTLISEIAATIQVLAQFCHTITSSGITSNVQCRIIKKEPITSGSVIVFATTGTTYVGVAVQIDMFSVQCCIATSRRRRSTSSSTAQYSVAISNDGTTFSDPVVVTALDSTCQNISTFANGSSYIELLSGYCFIDGVCYNESQTNPSSSCQYCTTTHSVFNWNDTCVYPASSGSSDDEGLPGYAIALIVILVVGVLVGVAIVGYIFILKKKLNFQVRDVFRKGIVREPSKGKFAIRQDAQVEEAWK